MLPELGGLDVLRVMRAESTVPIVIVTAKDSEADKVAGLELGADDYVTKPFSLRELLARVRAVLRRGRLLTRDHLITEVWGPDYFGDTKTLDVHVKRLRQKIEEDPHRPVYLITVRGLGYRFVD